MCSVCYTLYPRSLYHFPKQFTFPSFLFRSAISSISTAFHAARRPKTSVAELDERSNGFVTVYSIWNVDVKTLELGSGRRKEPNLALSLLLRVETQNSSEHSETSFDLSLEQTRAQKLNVKLIRTSETHAKGSRI